MVQPWTSTTTPIATHMVAFLLLFLQYLTTPSPTSPPPHPLRKIPSQIHLPRPLPYPLRPLLPSTSPLVASQPCSPVTALPRLAHSRVVKKAPARPGMHSPLSTTCLPALPHHLSFAQTPSLPPSPSPMTIPQASWSLRGVSLKLSNPHPNVPPGSLLPLPSPPNTPWARLHGRERTTMSSPDGPTAPTPGGAKFTLSLRPARTTRPDTSPPPVSSDRVPVLSPPSVKRRSPPLPRSSTLKSSDPTLSSSVNSKANSSVVPIAALHSPTKVTSLLLLPAPSAPFPYPRARPRRCPSSPSRRRASSLSPRSSWSRGRRPAPRRSDRSGMVPRWAAVDAEEA